MKLEDTSRGFDDTIIKITHATGIAKIVKIVTPNYGCDERQEWLNKKIPYKNKKMANLTNIIGGQPYYDAANANSESLLNFWKGTQAQYNAIGTKILKHYT